MGIAIATSDAVSVDQPFCRRGKGGDTVECEGQFDLDAVQNGSNTSGSSLSKSFGPLKKYAGYDRLIAGPDGKPCLTVGYAEVGTAPADGAPAVPQPGDVNPINGLYPSCPATPVQFGQTPAPSSASPVETTSMVAARYWEQIPLPKPQPAIAPGRAITGKLAYLQTRGETARSYTNNTVFGRLEIVARGSYTVDWGDGETSGPRDYEGMAWPDGKITHDYINVGQYNVVVTEKWSATWKLGSESGTLRTLQTTGRIDNFPVQQIQAVVVIGR